MMDDGELSIWVLGTDPETGQRVIVGPFEDGLEVAEQTGDLEDVQQFELPTTSKPRATQIIKAKLLQKSGKTSDALRRVLHREARTPGEPIAPAAESPASMPATPPANPNRSIFGVF